MCLLFLTLSFLLTVLEADQSRLDFFVPGTATVRHGKVPLGKIVRFLLLVTYSAAEVGLFPLWLETDSRVTAPDGCRHGLIGANLQLNMGQIAMALRG